MEATLYLPYYDYNDGLFDVSNDYYNSDEYARKVSDEYNKSKDVVYNSMLDMKNGSSSVFVGGDGQTYKFGQKSDYSEEKVAYSSCESVIYNSDGKEETVDEVITHFVKMEPFVCMVELDMDTSEEEFETELSMWNNEHCNINKYKASGGEEWVWGNEPKRNLKMKFLNNGNETVYAVLENCKIMDRVEYNMFIVYVEKIRLIDNI